MGNDQDYIVSICRALSAAAKTPSLALVRAKANRPLAIPDVMRVLKRWKEDPNGFELVQTPAATEPEVPQDLEGRVERLEKEINDLKAQMAALRQALDLK